MNKLDEIADQLNEWLDQNELDEKRVAELIDFVFQSTIYKFRMLDFEFHSEDRMLEAKSLKETCVKLQNLKWAADARETERECMQYLRIRKYFNIKKSFFYPDFITLVYLHLGFSENDQKIKRIVIDKQKTQKNYE